MIESLFSPKLVSCTLWEFICQHPPGSPIRKGMGTMVPGPGQASSGPVFYSQSIAAPLLKHPQGQICSSDRVCAAPLITPLSTTQPLNHFSTFCPLFPSYTSQSSQKKNASVSPYMPQVDPQPLSFHWMPSWALNSLCKCPAFLLPIPNITSMGEFLRSSSQRNSSFPACLFHVTVPSYHALSFLDICPVSY